MQSEKLKAIDAKLKQVSKDLGMTKDGLYRLAVLEYLKRNYNFSLLDSEVGPVKA